MWFAFLVIMLGIMHGRGRFEWPSTGEVYNGAWSKGKMTGEGIKVSADGSRAQGVFLDGTLDGWAEKVMLFSVLSR